MFILSHYKAIIIYKNCETREGENTIRKKVYWRIHYIRFYINVMGQNKTLFQMCSYNILLNLANNIVEDLAFLSMNGC